MPGAEEDRKTLEVPPNEDFIYHSRGHEVVATRPLLTGDVLSGIEIPGLGDRPGLAILLTHPCSMRTDGVALKDRLFAARVTTRAPIPLKEWRGHSKVMPLPKLTAEHVFYAGVFDDAGMVPSQALSSEHRVACLSESGINLLQQRLIWHLTRFLAPTFRLHESCVGVFREIDLHDEWAETLQGVGHLVGDIDVAFHDWIRESPGGGRSRQELLTDDQQVVAVRKEMRAHLKAVVGS